MGLNIPQLHEQEIVALGARKEIPVLKIEKIARSFAIRKVSL